MGPSISKIGVIVVYVNNLTTTRAFWEKQIGLKVRFADREWVEYNLGNTSFAIHTKKKPTASRPINAYIHFQVPNIRTAVKDLEKKGVLFTKNIVEAPFGWLAPFKDPDGNKYWLFQPRFEF